MHSQLGFGHFWHTWFNAFVWSVHATSNHSLLRRLILQRWMISFGFNRKRKYDYYLVWAPTGVEPVSIRKPVCFSPKLEIWLFWKVRSLDRLNEMKRQWSRKQHQVCIYRISYFFSNYFINTVPSGLIERFYHPGEKHFNKIILEIQQVLFVCL